jgi:hypothetical protein
MNHYHVIIARADACEPNRHVKFEAETLEQARRLVTAKYGEEAVLKVWQDYFEITIPHA